MSDNDGDQHRGKSKRQKVDVAVSPEKDPSTASADVASTADGTLAPARTELQDVQSQVHQLQSQLENYVQKELENYVQKKEQKKELQNYVTLEEHGKVVGRLNRLVTAMSPATLFAQFETAVCAFIASKIPQGWEEKSNVIQHGVASNCLVVLETLIKGDLKPNKWKGPATRARVGFPKEATFPLLRAGLEGTIVFVEETDEDDIKAFDASGRHKLVHDGIFLNKMFESPGPGDAKGGNYDETKQRVRKYQNEVRSRAASASSSTASASTASSSTAVLPQPAAPPTPRSSFNDIIQRLKSALEEKNFQIDMAMVDHAVKELDKMASSSTTAFTHH